MVYSLAVRTDIAEERRKEYRQKLDSMGLTKLVREFLTYLDYTEESDNGYVFHPITIGSCRVLMSEPLGMVLSEIRKQVKE